MNTSFWRAEERFLTAADGAPAIPDDEIRQTLAAVLAERAAAVEGGKLRRVLLVPPDITRLNAYAGPIVTMLWELLPEAEVDVLPALGTHVPMTDAEREFMYPTVPAERMLVHDWRTGTRNLGTVPAELILEWSEGRMNSSVEVELSNYVLDPKYDLVISIGQIVPHEVVGMANYSKNLFVGCGGRQMINVSHYLGALYGMERMMGRGDTPVRRLLDYAEENCIAELPLVYVLTVTTTDPDETVRVRSLGVGRSRALFDKLVVESQRWNLDLLDEPIDTCVVYLKPEEFRTTWVGNKSIYRTRMAMADDGDLIIIAPGVALFGEDEGNDVLIDRYGYVGADRVAELVATKPDLADALGVAAHLVHGSSEGRFRITYVPGGLSREQVEGVGFNYMSPAEAQELYPIDRFQDGWNDWNGRRIFYISNPALGLWALRAKFEEVSE
ncbi:MAG: lactate racemase domain-containing protein [Bacillota bacterium]|nr:lactate racemase domain-containing protein [Bacillota bacterium]